MPFNVSQNSGTLVVAASARVGWLELAAPPVGRISRLTVTQIAGTVENVVCLVDVYNAEAAKTADLAPLPLDMPQYKVLAQTSLPGNGTNVSVYPNQAYSNQDGDNSQRQSKLWIRLDLQSDVTKTYRVTLVTETEQ